MKTVLFLVAAFLLSFATSTAQSVSEPPQVGEKAPSFQGADQNGNTIVSEALLKEGAVVLVFYRGFWCGYCNKYLKELEESLEEIQQKGATVVAVTFEQSDYIAQTEEKTGTSFPIIHDKDRAIADAYGVTFTLDAAVLQKYTNYGIDLSTYHGNSDNVLPVPATYVIGRDGKVNYVHFDPDYKNRPDINEIMKNL